MARFLRILIVWNVLCLYHVTAAYEGLTAIGPNGKQLVEFVQQAERVSGFSGAVLAGEHGKIIAAIAVGKSGKQSHDVTTLFELASCTKPFTAIAVMKLAEDGKLHLDDPINKYLEGVPENCHGITVRHLLQHTSGISPDNSRGRGTDLADILPQFLEGGPQTPPGEHHAYWNQGYALLSEVIAVASGMPYTTYMRENIFEPCQMKASRFNGDSRPKGIKVATGTSTYGKSRTALEHPYGEYGFQYRGMGGLVTNLADLWRWDRTLAKGKLISADSYAQMTTAGQQAYALGWRIYDKDGHTIHEHTGSVRGFLALIRRVPETDSCLFILANSDNAEPFDIVAQGCSEILAGRNAEITVPKAVNASLAEQLVGSYRDPNGRTMTVSKEKDSLAAVIDWNGPKSLGKLNMADNGMLSFDMVGSKNAILIDRDPQSQVIGLTITDLDPPIKFSRE